MEVEMEQLTVSVRELRRDKAGEVETAVASGEIVRVEDYGFIVSALNPAVVWMITPEPAHSCYSLYTRGDGDDRVVVPARMSQNHPIPLRFGTSAEVKAWMVPLSWGPRLGL